MLYEKFKDKALTKELFKNPPKEFRGAPFWAWNTTLKKDVLTWQIEQFQKMGFGGFFMHSRAGMASEYLGEEFLSLISACNKKAKELGLLSYLYDEDRWPSGAAGGLATKEAKYRQRFVWLSRKTIDEMFADEWSAYSEGVDPECIKIYDICFDENDLLKSVRIVEEGDAIEGEKWYLYLTYSPLMGWVNGYTHVDYLSKEAIGKFIEVTHETFYKNFGEEFGKTMPAIFSDEPAFGHVEPKQSARDQKSARLAWTVQLPEMFQKKYGYDIFERLPEIIWETPTQDRSVRYDYHKLITERFAESFCDQVGDWCKNHHIAFTGHVHGEDDLTTQVMTVGDSMRQYKNMAIPGIDMLCNGKHYSTAKQAQSVVHQYGKAGMMSELYGVTGWDFDFRGHKYQGDWQAALGVNLRVPHLAWVSMLGSAKRDYPASIFYQSPWYKEYGYVEDHFARVNTAMTRGKAKVNIGVIHPMESAWLLKGVRSHVGDMMKELDEQYLTLVEWLLRAQLDFDFIDEMLLPEQHAGNKEGFDVGCMEYTAVLVPPVYTLRQSTITALENFMKKGGKVIVCGDTPSCVDGKQSKNAAALYEKAVNCPFKNTAIVGALEGVREVEIRSQNGLRRDNLLYQMREDGAEKWLFIAQMDQSTRFLGEDTNADEISITISGEYAVKHYNTLTGEVEDCDYVAKAGKTTVYMTCYPQDSFLLQFTPSKEGKCSVQKEKKTGGNAISLPQRFAYTLSEKNAMILDIFEWSYDGVHFEKREEILRIDNKIREKYHYPLANGEDKQPWCIQQVAPDVFPYLRVRFESEVEADCSLACERIEECYFNGEKVELKESGYYVDRDIRTYPMPKLKKGLNEILVRVPISARISMEAMFLLGDFGVEVLGSESKIIPLPKTLSFGSIIHQGLPFYGGEITYLVPFTSEGGEVEITTDYYLGAVINANIDGDKIGKIAYAPYKITKSGLQKGEHLLELTLFTSRVNTFGALHTCVPIEWVGPPAWYMTGSSYSYEYQLKDVGIMKVPTIVEYQ